MGPTADCEARRPGIAGDTPAAARSCAASSETRKAFRASSASSSPSSSNAPAVLRNRRTHSQRVAKRLSSSPISHRAATLRRGSARGVAHVTGMLPTLRTETTEAAGRTETTEATGCGWASSWKAARNPSNVGRRASSTRRQERISEWAASGQPSGGKPSMMTAASRSCSPCSKSSASNVNFSATAARFSHALHGDWPLAKSSQSVAPTVQTSVRWLILFCSICSGGHHRVAIGCF
mmetsp:Transcript_92965/g.268465  ORF Transcript_92965/g.268465 Transcript_92965/m.268465 type:complete len:236 (-) Transcript_92965:723-1430(-)